MQFGPQLRGDHTRFRLWGPAGKVELLLADPVEMTRGENGWFTADVKDAGPGTLYRYRIDGKTEVPDPASAFQPQDVSGPSEVIDHGEFEWACADWRARPWEEAAFLELHVGAFTQQGTYRAAIDKLDHVVDAGFTAIELMPLADFPGRRNWGYDGVLLYAPDSSYGRPEDLKAFIDAAHQRRLMVFLDVVYNHFGPEGNYLSLYAPDFFSDAHTPWGHAIDYRVPQVRAFAIENALHWLDHYRFDGLRLDAVHAIVEPGTPSVLQELSEAVGTLSKRSNRYIHLVLENDDNIATLLDPESDPQGRYRAQWNDDYHHACHVLLTGESHGYYGDYQKSPREQLTRILASGFAYQGEPSEHRGGQTRGEPSGMLPPTAFVNFLQNHDQIGNRALGDRLTTLAEDKALETALAVTLLAPMPPLMFMGDEWGAQTPFPFFCDFAGDLAEAVRRGRRKEFKDAYEKLGEEVPDPLDVQTFQAAKLNWDELASDNSQRKLALVRNLLHVRRAEIAPHLVGVSFQEARWIGDALLAGWRLDSGEILWLLANFSDRETQVPTPEWRPIYGGKPSSTLPPWTVFAGIGAP